jgi:elongation factor Ts
VNKMAVVTPDLIKQLREKTGAGIVDCKKALEANEASIEKAIDWLREKGITKAAKKADRIAAEGLSAVSVSGDFGIVVEINSETDFVAKNENFINLVNSVAQALLAAKPSTFDLALKAKLGNGTVSDAIVGATSKIGEKISLRRFELVKKGSDEIFGHYTHMGGKIATLTVLKNIKDALIAKDIAMHVAASAPQYLRKEEVGKDYIEKETRIQLELAKNDPKLQGKSEVQLVGILKGKVEKGLKEICLNEQPFVKDPNLTVAQFVKNSGGEVSRFVRYQVGEGLEKRADNFAEEVMLQVRK